MTDPYPPYFLDRLERTVGDWYEFGEEIWKRPDRLQLLGIHQAMGGFACAFHYTGRHKVELGNMHSWNHVPLWMVWHWTASGRLKHIPSDGPGGVL